MFKFMLKKKPQPAAAPQVYTPSTEEPPLIEIPMPAQVTIPERKRIERMNAVIPNLRKRYIDGFREGAFAAFPGMELLRVRLGIEDGINWQKRWTDAGGKLYDGRMIALKTDPIWAKISDYGVPYPPFEFHDVMGTQDIGRKECLALGFEPPRTKTQLAMRKAGVAPKIKVVRITKG